jgi:hypothetical protein
MTEPSADRVAAAIDDATEAVNDALNRLGPPPSMRDLTDPTAQLRETQTDFEDTLADLLATQKALTAMEAQRDRLAVLNAELKAEAGRWREMAERHLANLDETARALSTANQRNRVLVAENEAALRRLNEMRGES